MSDGRPVHPKVSPEANSSLNSSQYTHLYVTPDGGFENQTKDVVVLG